MKICSFLPSATEILFALGVGEEVVGVTFACDYPQGAEGKPVVVRRAMQSGLSPREIDDVVRATAAQGGSLYFVDWERMEALAPDLIVAQDLCRVCAISTPTVARELQQLASAPEVLSLSPHSLADVFAEIELVGAAVGRQGEAVALCGALRARIAAVQGRVERARMAGDGRGLSPRVLCLEWLDPLYQGGHWIPEMVELAGGEAVLAVAGEKSVRLRWEDVIAANPEFIVLMPCGYHLQETIEQVQRESWVASLPAAWGDVAAVRNHEVYAVDGTAYFSRPGPRLVDGLEILEAILQRRGFEHLPAESVTRLG